jgi:hypothetical protein
VKWDTIVTLGEPGDPENDPTKLWFSDRNQGGHPHHDRRHAVRERLKADMFNVGIDVR